MEEYFDSKIPKYAMLCDRWGSDEITYKDCIKERRKDSAGYKEILALCDLSRNEGFSYGWVDTVCIDKRWGAELSEATDSMFRW